MSDCISVQLPQEVMVGKIATSGLAVPTHINTECPFCGAAASINLTAHQANQSIGMGSAIGSCPKCGSKARFSFSYGMNEKNEFVGRPLNVRMYPAPKRSYEMPDLPSSVPEPLRRSFTDTVRAFNAQIYGATATSGRRTLEGIVKYMLPEAERKKPLAKLIESAEQHFDYKAPLSRLSHAIRYGGNLGAHYDDENEPDSEMALAIVDLLFYLIEYIYVLPDRIERLEKSLNNKNSGDSGRIPLDI